MTYKCLIRLLGKSNPNTYTFSKSLAEQILQREKHNVPLAIVRPSIVTGADEYTCIYCYDLYYYRLLTIISLSFCIASAKEPTPGWIDSLYGPTGETNDKIY